MAKRGMLFTNAHCVSPKCAPSRAAIMTGLRPSTTGLYENQHWWYPNFPNMVTMPMRFRQSGYSVAGAGKIFHHTAGNNPPRQWNEFKRLLFRDDPWFRGSKLNYPWTQHTPNPKGFPFSGVRGLPHARRLQRVQVLPRQAAARGVQHPAAHLCASRVRDGGADGVRDDGEQLHDARGGCGGCARLRDAASR